MVFILEVGARGIKVILIENDHVDQGSLPEQDILHFA